MKITKTDFFSLFLASLIYANPVATTSNVDLLLADDFVATSITLQAHPQQYVASNVLQELCGVNDSNQAREPCVNTLAAILQHPNTLLHYSLFTEDCSLYRTLINKYSESRPHQSIAIMMSRTTMFRALHCDIYVLIDRLKIIESETAAIDIVSIAYETGFLRSTNAHILTNYLLYDDTDHIGFDAFDHLMSICNRLDARLSQ